MVDKVQEFQFLYEICSLLIKAQENEEIFHSVTENLCKVFGAVACSLWLVGSHTELGQQRLAFFQRDHSLTDLLPTLDFKIVNRVISEKKTFVCHNLQEDSSFHEIKKDNLMVTAYPLHLKGELIGVLNFWCNNEDYEIYKNDSLWQRVVSEIAYATYNFKYYSNIQHKRLKRELEIAHKMQLDLMPKDIPAIKGISIAARTLAAHEVGGDYIDLFMTKGNNLGIAIGDVMGKGIPAALWASVTRATLRMAARDDRQPHLVIGDVNDTLFQDLSTQGAFLTLLYAWYEPMNKTLLFSNAGHFNPILFHTETGRYKILKVNGPYIGGIEQQNYRLGGVRLQRGDIVFLYTDGLIEAVNSRKQQFGLNNVIDIIKKNSFYKASEIIDNLCLHLGQYMGNYRQLDDISCILLKVES